MSPLNHTDESQVDQVVEKMLARIVDGRWAAGVTLPSLERLAHELDTSYLVVSAALSRLRARKLIRPGLHEGLMVVALDEVATPELLGPIIRHSPDLARRLGLTAQLYGFLRLLLPDVAERAAEHRTESQLGWMRHYLHVLRDRRGMAFDRADVGRVELELWRTLASAAGNLCFVLAINPLENTLVSDALVDHDALVLPLGVYATLVQALQARDAKAAGAVLERALWGRESQCIAQLRNFGWTASGGVVCAA